MQDFRYALPQRDTFKFSENTVAITDSSENLKPWKKGESGNPAGKPKGVKNRSTIVKEWLDAKATDGGKGTVADQLVRAMITKASKGDVPAFRELMDSAYGKVKDESEMDITYNLMPELKLNGKPMEFNIGQKAPRRK